MNLKKMCVIPQCNFEAVGSVRERYNVLANEYVCSWIRNESVKENRAFDYEEIFQKMQVVKTQFTEEERKYVLNCYEHSFSVKILLPEILKWPKGIVSLELIAILYTMPNDTTPRHLLCATLDTDSSTGQPIGTIFAKRSTDFGNFAVTQSFRIHDFEHPDQAIVEYLPLR
jgi:hypothetical protein